MKPTNVSNKDAWRGLLPRRRSGLKHGHAWEYLYQDESPSTAKEWIETHLSEDVLDDLAGLLPRRRSGLKQKENQSGSGKARSPSTAKEWIETQGHSGTVYLGLGSPSTAKEWIETIHGNQHID